MRTPLTVPAAAANTGVSQKAGRIIKDHQGRFSEGVVVALPVIPVDAVSEGGVVAYMLVAV